MFKREELGRRIKKVREARGMTLKAVELAAEISATHVSEIERGKTSPTLGALLRIAGALGKDPSYFVEEEDLGDVSRVSVEDRVSESLPGGAGTMDRLTTSIPGGRLQARHLILKPGAVLHRDPHQHDGNEAALVLDGVVRVIVDQDRVELTRGDSVHFDAGAPHTIENASAVAQASLIWVCSNRRAD